MGWEWRCFVPSPLPTAAAALLPAPELELAPECRTDNYLLVDSDEVGIKLRGGGGQLEVKTRKDAKSRLAEKWKKCGQSILWSTSPSHCAVPESVLTQIRGFHRGRRHRRRRTR
eukprot:SAG31_NODE_22_length_33849_cov_13.713096_24_plen_114_part_00